MLAAQEPEDPEDIQLAPESGLGEQSLWGSSAAGGIWVALRGRQMLTVTLAGEVRNAARYKEPLKRLAMQALERM
jgi:hypothetical protein